MTLTINVNEQEAQMILSGLAELPAKHSIDLILKLKTDFESQIKESAAEEVEVVKKNEREIHHLFNHWSNRLSYANTHKFTICWRISNV